MRTRTIRLTIPGIAHVRIDERGNDIAIFAKPDEGEAEFPPLGEPWLPMTEGEEFHREEEWSLERTNITDLDEALYAASCLAASGKDQTVTIMGAVVDGHERYYIADGDLSPMGTIRDNPTGIDWKPVYTLHRPLERLEGPSDRGEGAANPDAIIVS